MRLVWLFLIAGFTCGGVGAALFLGEANVNDWVILGFLLAGKGLIIMGGVFLFLEWLSTDAPKVAMKASAAVMETERKYRIHSRAKTAGKRFARWLDRKFPPDDPGT